MLSDGARLKAIRFPFGENTGRPTNAEPKSRTVSTLESDSLTVEMLQSKRPDPALVSTRHRDDARSSGGIPGSPKRAGLATPLWSEVARAFPPVWEPLAVRVESADLQRGGRIRSTGRACRMGGARRRRRGAADFKRRFTRPWRPTRQAPEVGRRPLGPRRGDDGGEAPVPPGSDFVALLARAGRSPLRPARRRSGGRPSR